MLRFCISRKLQSSGYRCYWFWGHTLNYKTLNLIIAYMFWGTIPLDDLPLITEEALATLLPPELTENPVHCKLRYH